MAVPPTPDRARGARRAAHGPKQKRRQSAEPSSTYYYQDCVFRLLHQDVLGLPKEHGPLTGNARIQFFGTRHSIRNYALSQPLQILENLRYRIRPPFRPRGYFPNRDDTKRGPAQSRFFSGVLQGNLSRLRPVYPYKDSLHDISPRVILKTYTHSL